MEKEKLALKRLFCKTDLSGSFSIGKMGEDSFKNFINENTINDFGINTENILKSFTGNDYVYSKTYDRIYKVIGGDIDYHDVPGDDGIPTILVDTNGGMYDFIILKAENVYEVLSTPNGFSYKEYSKSVGR